MNGDINQEILNELRRLRRLSQWSVYLCLLVLGVFAAYITFFRPQLLRSRSARDSQATVWSSIEAALDRCDNQRALSIAQSFVQRQPGYHYAHAILGSVYVAMSDFTNAEAAYVRAFELYPTAEHEKALAAIRQRLARERAKEAQAKKEKTAGQDPDVSGRRRIAIAVPQTGYRQAGTGTVETL